MLAAAVWLTTAAGACCSSYPRSLLFKFYYVALIAAFGFFLIMLSILFLRASLSLFKKFCFQ